MVKYFAYGSNMSSDNLKNRDVTFTNKQKGILKGYKFTINKKSYKDPTIGYANVIPDDSSIVEGVLYDMEDSEILKLDKFEGYPKHYDKIKDYVEVNGFYYEAIIYVGQKAWTSDEELKTTEEYKNKILEGRESVSEKYFEFLNENIKVKSSKVDYQVDN